MPKMEYRGGQPNIYHGKSGNVYRVSASRVITNIHEDDVAELRKSGKWVLIDSPYPYLRHISENEIDALQEISKGLPNNPTVVNIGAGTGCSSLSFLLSRKDLRLITVDRQKESHPEGCLEAELDAIVRAGIDKNRHEQIHMDSKEAGKSWTRGQVDMVFVDGDHSYEGCLGDIAAWLPHVKQNGVMAFHDCEPKPMIWGEVYRAVEEAMTPKFKKIMHVDNMAAFLIKRDK